MAERRADLLSLVTGLLAVTFAGLALLGLSGAVAVDARVCTAVALVAVGAHGPGPRRRHAPAGGPVTARPGP